MTLLQVRGRKQAAVTVLLSSIERFIVAEDDDKVQRQLDMLHQAFDLYEAAHLEVLTSLDGDPQEHCKESLKFVDIERSYTLGVKNAKSYLKRANISVNDPTTTMCQLMNVPKVELRAFSGDSSDYLSFMSIFNETVDNAPLSGQAKLTRLLGYTRDKARLAIDHCSLIGGDEGYQEAKKILQERFGDQYVIATNLIRSLQTGKSVHSAEDLRLLSDQLHNAALVLKGKNTYSELDSQHNLKKICSRLSSHLNNKWRERVFAIKRKHMRYASFGEFVAFMKEKSDEANDPLYSQDSSSKQQASSNRPVTSSMNCVSTLKSPLKCVLCNESHLLFKCTKFKNMDYDDRQSVISRNKLCVNCLRPSHTVPQCKYKRFCNVSDCTTKHNGLLHKFTSVASNSATNKSVNAVMPILHVMINNTLKVRCLLDTGSTSSFVTKNLVSKLDLPRSPVKLSIMTLNSSVAEESHIVNFDIESMDHNYCVNMTNIFVVDHIPGKAYNLDVTQYPHLYNIDVIDNFDGCIDLLIGQDYADCFQPLELLKGNKNEPYAVRIPLGYVVHGPNSQYVASNCVVSNLVSASTLQRDVNRLWELDQFDIVPDAKCIMSDDGKDNPADIVSRGTSPDRLYKSIWLQGPPFLSQYKSDWKTNCPNVDELDVDDRELKKSVALVCTQGSIHPIDLLCSHFSSWYKLKKALSWILRVRNALLHRTSCKGLISVDELKESERIILRHVQLSCFPSEVASLVASKSVAKSSVLHKLSPMLNEERLLVVQGRLTHSPVGVDHRFPIVVPHKHPISSLIVSDIHGSAHLGQEWVVSIVRNRFWITNMRRVVKRVARDCIVCKKRFAAPGCQRMADLPSSRVTPYNPPFFAVGLDCFGPFLVTHGRSQAKRYGCVFSCFATRAFHVEKLHSLDTDSMINALRRFIARRGNPDNIFCDNGTNLTSCCKELKRSLKALSQSDLHSFCLSHEIKWNFAPPQSSHMGGVYERMIRTFRRVFTGILNPRTRLTDEILSTVFCEVESIINGRPVTKTTTDVDDLSVLTPNHLLLLRGVVNVSPGVFELGDVFRKRWRYVQSLANLFWKRWLSCYLPDLQRRVKWQDKNRNLRVGDLVLICDITAPRGSWPLGVVMEVHVGRDELVRSARVRTSTSQLVRPVTKLVLLEGYDVQ